MAFPKLIKLPENPWMLRSIAACILLTLAFISISMLLLFTETPVPYPPTATCVSSHPWIPPQVLSALLHYSTTKVIPQQKRAEIQLSLSVLAARSPANFLVFGLGHDSSLWNALNFKGKTVFLEEDATWIKTALKTYPTLKAYHVKYPTKLSEADDLLSYYRSDKSCAPTWALRKSKCRLALADLVQEIYETEWDVIMIDAPRGYFEAAPGRMTAIFSAAVMAKRRREGSVTDVFLHDVNRRVEKAYAEEFLCRRNLVGSKGRLWHFRIRGMGNGTSDSREFCRR